MSAHESDSDSDSEVSYVDVPLLEEDSECENEGESNVAAGSEAEGPSKKKRKLQELKEKAQRKKALKIEEQREAEAALRTTQYQSATGQRDLLLQNQPMGGSFVDMTSLISVDDILVVADSGSAASSSSSAAAASSAASYQCPQTVTEALALSGLKRALKTGAFETGSPVALVVCSSAARCTQVIANMSKKFHCRVAKLFSKHFKLEDQIEALKKGAYPVAVGTPNRIFKLIEVGALSLTRCTTVVLDNSEDSKSFTLLSWPETKTDAYQLLQRFVLPEIGHISLSVVSEPMQLGEGGNGSGSSGKKYKPKPKPKTSWKERHVKR